MTIDRSSAVTKANNVINNINNFMKSNLLHMNIEKSCYIHYSLCAKVL